MSNRTCRYCGEAGHNVRNCAQAKKTEALASRLEHRLLEKTLSVVTENIPISSLEASMLHCELVPSGSLIDLPWNSKGKIRELIRPMLMQVSESPSQDIEHIINAASVHIKSDKNQTVSYLVTSESYKRDRMRLQSVMGYLNLDVPAYIQSKIDELGDNSYKQIWNSMGRNDRMKNYTGIEGNEGTLVMKYLDSVMQDLNHSSYSKRTGHISRLFKGLTTALHTTTTFKITDHIKISGEWFNGESPDLEIEWHDIDHLLTFNLMSNDKVRSEVVSSIKTVVENTLYSDAIACRLDSQDWNCGVQEERVGLAINNYKDPGGKSNSQPVRSPFFESISVAGDLFYETTPPQQVVDDFTYSIMNNMSGTKNAIKDFIRMGHSGGYSQNFDHGKNLNRSKSFSLESNLNITQNTWDGGISSVNWMNVGVPNGAIAISDVVNSVLDIYVNASRKSL